MCINEKMTGIKFVDVFIDVASDETLKQGAAQILEQIRPDWLLCSISWKIFTDGLTNKLIGAWHKDHKEDTVLFRVYGEGTDAIIDRKAEIENMARAHSIGIGSQLYAMFQNGLAYEFIHGNILDLVTVKDARIYPMIAKMMAKFHTIDIKNESCGLWNRMLKFIKMSPSELSDPVKNARLQNEFPRKDELLSEYNMLKDALDKSSVDLVFCHNDALLANIVDQKNRVVFIDMEYAGPAPAAYDIANHFVEHVGADGELDYLTLYPNKEFQLDWIKIYLTEFNRLKGVSPPSDTAVHDMYNKVQQFVLCSHLQWIAWSLIQAANSSIDFDFVDYAIQRMKEYKRIKSLVTLK
eukprot:TRINITY_DN36553_c0_g1_i1.p1 TRINITY_DN36553_c0_g1~~TRINITY_DN36553_c0_g1_i1.p1  ORF type:complete len:352 (-),score=53.13 TRINITY_DN36553_c0_g1_i1:59-1114(-)